MSRLRSERRGQLVTAAIGVTLTLALGLVLLFGYRLVTHIRASINALQASRLAPIPAKRSRICRTRSGASIRIFGSLPTPETTRRS
jgi:hypothetical protein